MNKVDIFSLIFGLIFITLIIIDTLKSKKYQPLIDDFHNPYNSFTIIFILVFSFVVLNFNVLNLKKKKYKKLKQITGQALFGFIIAVCARLDMCFLPFYLIFIIGYASEYKHMISNVN